MTDSTTIRPRANYQTAEAMRQSLIERIAAFLRATKMAKTKLGVAALNDGHAIKDIEAGRNLTLETYQRLDGFMTHNWPTETESPALATGNLEKENG